MWPHAPPTSMIITMSEDALPTRREVLCEHVHATVKTLAPAEHVNKVTGMLVECSDDDLLYMLASADVIKRRIQQALHALTGEVVDLSNGSSCGPIEKSEQDVLGEQLFDKIAAIESQLCAQITGMLLELPRDELERLMANAAALKVAVQKARLEYLHTHHPQTLPSKDELGEQVFDHVEQLYPEYSPQVTGMLMEMDLLQIMELLKEPDKLATRAEQAYETLMKHHEASPTS